jgi:hypothetical protein
VTWVPGRESRFPKRERPLPGADASSESRAKLQTVSSALTFGARARSLLLWGRGRHKEMHMHAAQSPSILDFSPSVRWFSSRAAKPRSTTSYPRTRRAHSLRTGSRSRRRRTGAPSAHRSPSKRAWRRAAALRPPRSPPGEGLSPSTVNVLWGPFNLAIGYLLVCRVGTFELRNTRHVLVLGIGVLLMTVMLARAFGRFHGGL